MEKILSMPKDLNNEYELGDEYSSDEYELDNDFKINKNISQSHKEPEIKKYERQKQKDIKKEINPPSYISSGTWELVDYDELKKIEQEKIEFIEKTLKEVLEMECNDYINRRRNGQYDPAPVISELNMNLKYGTINIKISKQTPIDKKKIMSIVAKKLAEFAIFHPFKSLGLITLTFLKLV